MDPYFLLMFLFFLSIFICCGLCCKRKQEGVVFSTPADNPCGVATAYPTQQTMVHQGGYVNQLPPQAIGGYGGQCPTIVGPYPVHIQQAPAPTSVHQPNTTAPYPTGMPQPNTTAPYPTTGPPYPVASGAPYPPVNMQNVKLPSYQEAVSAPPPTNELYAQQSPYNPNYQ